MKMSLQTIFCLPGSFPHAAVRGLLRIQPFEVTLWESRLVFIHRVLNPISEVSKVFDFDARVLREARVGFCHYFIHSLEIFFDTSDLEELNLADISYRQHFFFLSQTRSFSKTMVTSLSLSPFKIQDMREKCMIQGANLVVSQLIWGTNWVTNSKRQPSS